MSKVAVQREPFEIRVYPDAATIILEGDLDASPPVQKQLMQYLTRGRSQPSWTIYADSARIISGGVDVWINSVRDYLAPCKLTYAASQLALILAHDRRYDDPNSTFEEY
jgi:hypothetical protein